MDPSWGREGAQFGLTRLVTDAREAAWDAVQEALSARWCVGCPSAGVVRPDGYRGAWSVAARGRRPGRGKAHRRSQGPDEVAPLRELDDRLRGRVDAGLGMVGRRRPRLAYVEGAEEGSRDNIGRSLTAQ